MKRMKALLGVVLVIAMVLSLSLTAFATGDLTVLNPGTHTYAAYQVFTADVSAAGEITYALPADGLFVDQLVTLDGENKLVSSKIEGLDFVTKGAVGPWTVSKPAAYSAAELAATLKAAITDSMTPAATSTNGEFTGLDNGYYLVVAYDVDTTDPAHPVTTYQDKAALVTIAGDHKSIQNKNDMPFDKTVDNVKAESVEIGDTVTFKITSKVPDDYDATWTSYTFIVRDEMTEGLTFNQNSVSIKIGGTTIAPPATVDVITYPSTILTGDQIRYTANGFELSLGLFARLAANPATLNGGEDIEITYTATVNDKALSAVSENDAHLDYGNDPTNLQHKDSQAKVYTAQIQIDKYENGSPETKLPGAVFTLQNAAGEYYTYNATTKDVAWVAVTAGDEIPAAAKFTTASDGSIEFIGLEDGIYTVTEITPPAGYVPLAEPISVTIDGSNAVDVTLSAEQVARMLTETLNVANTPGTALPSTGGRGTTMLYMAGLGMMLAAGAFLIFRRRAEAGK